MDQTPNNKYIFWEDGLTFFSATTKNFHNKLTEQFNINNFVIPSFDLDNTLIETKSGKFPIFADDWKFCFDKKILDSFKFIVIFSNQLNLTKQPKRLKNFKTKIINIFNELKPEIQLFVSTSRDIYRKPQDGLFHLFTEKIDSLNVGLDIIKNNMFYVGDSFDDNNNYDINFAKNIGVKFISPKEFIKKMTK